ncbi:unnamed protein product [Agarophyton chilense]
MNSAFAYPFFPIRLNQVPKTATLALKRPSNVIRMSLSDKKQGMPFSSRNSKSSSPLQPPSQSPPVESFSGSNTVYFMAIANEFRMASLFRRLLKCKDEYGGIEVNSVGSVLRIVKSEPHLDSLAEAFVFAYGCMVAWGTAKDRDDFVSLVVEDALHLRPVPATDRLKYVYGRLGALRRDIITLKTHRRAASSKHNSGEATTSGSNATNTGFKDKGSKTEADDMDPVLERLAVSCALAQSIKLGAFESALQRTIENTRHLPEELALTGRINASRREVSRLMGQLFLARYRYHLSGDLLMTPVFFREKENYVPTYNRVERYLEVRERGEVLNRRVEVMQELYKLLGDELVHKNSMALELAITVMIAFEILLTLITLAKESVRGVFSACALFACLIGTGWALWMLYSRRRRSAAHNRSSTLNYGFRELGL